MHTIKKVFLAMILSLGLLTFSINASEIKNPDEVVVEVNDKKITNQDYYGAISLQAGIEPALAVLDLRVLEEKYKDDPRAQKIIDENYQSFLSSLKADNQKVSDAFALYNAKNKEEYLRNSNILVNSYRQLAAIDSANEHIFTKKEKEYIFQHRFSPEMAIYQILIAPEVKLDSSEEEIEAAKAKALQKAEEVSEKINDLASFKELAKEFSSDQSNDTGYLGTFDINQAREAGMEQAIVNEAFSLEDKTFSQRPIETMFGYVIVFVEHKSEGKQMEDVENEIADILYEMYSGHNKNIEAYALTLFRKDNKINIKDDHFAGIYANIEIEARKAYIQFNPDDYSQYFQ